MSVQSSGDIEQSESWLDGLFRLNQVIAGTGVPLEGNLFYEHRDSSFVDRPPDPRLRPKRDRFRSVAMSHSRLLEIGVNGGHSAYAALTANPELTYFGVDICDHAYVRPAIRWLQAEFPDRVSFESGNSLKTLPALRREGLSVRRISRRRSKKQLPRRYSALPTDDDRHRSNCDYRRYERSSCRRNVAPMSALANRRSTRRVPDPGRRCPFKRDRPTTASAIWPFRGPTCCRSRSSSGVEDEPIRPKDATVALRPRCEETPAAD